MLCCLFYGLALLKRYSRKIILYSYTLFGLWLYVMSESTHVLRFSNFSCSSSPTLHAVFFKIHQPQAEVKSRPLIFVPFFILYSASLSF